MATGFIGVTTLDIFIKSYSIPVDNTILHDIIIYVTQTMSHRRDGLRD